MAKNKNKNKFFSFISRLLSIAIIAISVTTLYDALKKPSSPSLNGDSSSSYGPPPVVNYQLDSPKGFSFDPNASMLSWEEVEKASGYRISYNETFIDVTAEITAYVVTVVDVENEFKIMAVGDNLPYKDSVWSEPIAYTIDLQQEMSIYDKVNIALAKAALENDLQLIDVVGITIAETSFINFQTICKTDKGIRNVSWVYSLKAESILQMLENVTSESFRRAGTYDLVDFAAAEALLKSKAFDGQMEELRNQGYTISVVDSCVRKGQKSGIGFVFDIVATYKAELGEEVKIFSSINEIMITYDAHDDMDNYVRSTRVARYRTVTEINFALHEEGGTLEYMKAWMEKETGA